MPATLPGEPPFSDYENPPTDPLTGQPTRITGRGFDERFRQDVSRANRRRLEQASRLRHELNAGSETAAGIHRKHGAEVIPIIPIANLGLRWELGKLLSVYFRPLRPGSEAVPFADDVQGVVYKLFPFKPGGAVGLKLVARNGPSGWDVGAAPATAEETLEKIAFLHDISGIPSEIVGMTDIGDVLVKQPLFTELTPEEKYHLGPHRAQAVAAVGGVQFTGGRFPDLRAVLHEGRPWFVGDLHPGNIMKDAGGNAVIIDALTGEVPARMLYDVPEIAAAFQQIQDKTALWSDNAENDLLL